MILIVIQATVKFLHKLMAHNITHLLRRKVGNLLSDIIKSVHLVLVHSINICHHSIYFTRLRLQWKLTFWNTDLKTRYTNQCSESTRIRVIHFFFLSRLKLVVRGYAYFISRAWSSPLVHQSAVFCLVDTDISKSSTRVLWCC